MNLSNFVSHARRIRHHISRSYIFCVILGLAQLPIPALAQTRSQTTASKSSTASVEGVLDFEREIDLAGSKLKLNGSGIRYKYVFKVYTAGLYLPVVVKTPLEVYASKGPKRFKVVFLRDTDASSLGKSMTDVMTDNLPRERLGKCIPGLIKLGEVFASKKKMVSGEGFTLDEIPGEGTVVRINGLLVAKIAEPEFFTCVMYNYFGDIPADLKLKSALLAGA